MAEEQDQTLQTEETDDVATKDEDTATKTAVKTSEKFDELLETEDVEETPSEEEDESKDSKPDKSKESDTEEEDTGTETKDETGEKGEDEPKISKELAKRAVDLGLTEDEVLRFENDAELERTVGILESIASEEDELEVSQPAPPDKSKDEEGKEGFKFDFTNESEIDPELLKNIKAMEKHYQDEVKGLREDVAAMKAGVQQQEQDRFIKRFDGMVANLGTEFTDVFGIGSTNDLSKRSNAFKARDKVRGRMYAFAKGLVDAGETIPDEQQLFDLAVNSLHGKKVKAVESLRSSKDTAKYAKGAHVGRASTKRTGSMTGHQRAVETSKKFDDAIDTSEE